MNDLLKNILASDAYWTVNKEIARQVGFNAAILLADLISKRAYFEKRGELQPDGSFFNTADNLEDDLGIGKEARISAQKALQAVGFLKVTKRGIPAKNYYLICDDAIIGALDGKSSRNQDDQSSTNRSTSTLETAPVIRIKNKNKGNKANSQNPPSKDEEEEIQIDLSLDFTPTVSPKISSPEKGRIVAEPKVEVSAEAILAKWKPTKIDHKELESNLGDLFTTLKHYSIPKDELSTKKILKSMFGPSPNKKIAWLVEKAEVLIDEQRELIYASEDLNILSAPTTSREMFDLLPGALPYLEDLRARGVTPADLNGMSLIEHANNRAYSDQFTTIPYKKEHK